MNGSVKRVILGEAIVLVAWLVIMFVCKKALMNPIVFVMSLGFGVLAFAMASISATMSDRQSTVNDRDPLFAGRIQLCLLCCCPSCQHVFCVYGVWVGRQYDSGCRKRCPSCRACPCADGAWLLCPPGGPKGCRRGRKNGSNGAVRIICWAAPCYGAGRSGQSRAQSTQG